MGKICVDLDIDRQNITVGSKDGGFMMIYGWYPGTPIENAEAVMDAMEKYSSYFSA